MMKLGIKEHNDKAAVTVLSLDGKLDGTNYTQLIDKVTEVYGSESTNLLLDMENVDSISGAGVWALHSVSLISCGGEPPNQEHGWAALHTMVKEIEEGRDVCFKIANLQPKVEQALDGMGMLNALDVHADLDSAIASF
jgi:anti-anti-sigma regulatory factor